MTVNADT